MDDLLNRVSELVTEFRRRRVVQVLGVYAAAAFVIAQVASLAQDAFRLPHWSLTLVVLLCVLGFPIAAVLAWALEITPEGVRRTQAFRPVEDGKRLQMIAPMAFVSVTVVGTVVLGLGAWHLFLRSDPTPSAGADESRSIATQRHRQLTFAGDVRYAAISPDGQSLAYETRSGDLFTLLLRDLEGSSSERLSGRYSTPTFTLEWAPEGSRLLYRERIVPRLGGLSRRVSEELSFSYWSPDGRRVATWHVAGVDSIRIIDLATGKTRSIKLDRPSKKGQMWGGDWPPAGNLLTLVREAERRFSLWTVSLDGPGQKVLEKTVGRISSPRWSPAGDAIYYLVGTDELRKIPVSQESGTRQGEPQTLITGLQAFNPIPHFSLTSNGRRLVYTKQAPHSSSLWLLSLQADTPLGHFKAVERIAGSGNKHSPRISPDGRWIAFVQERHGRAGDVFRMPVNGGPAEQLTFTGQVTTNVAWSPDGTQLAFGASLGDATRVWIVDADGGLARPFEHTDVAGIGHALAWAPGQRILYQRREAHSFQLLDPKSGEETLLVGDTEFKMYNPHYSPDGEHVAVFWDRPERGIWLVSLADSSEVLAYEAPGPALLGWSSDGDALYIVDRTSEDLRQTIQHVPLTAGDADTLARLPSQCERFLYVAPPALYASDDGLQLVCSTTEWTSDVWMIEDFDPEAFGR